MVDFTSLFSHGIETVSVFTVCIHAASHNVFDGSEKGSGVYLYIPSAAKYVWHVATGCNESY